MINYINNDIHFNFANKRKCSRWIKDVVPTLTNSKYVVGDINIVFCDDNYILSVNKKFLNHNYYTDIITFDYCDNNIISGDLIISVDTVKQNSDLYKTDFKEELNRVIIHGVLHLLGYNDSTQEEIVEMREMENFALELINSSKYD